MHYESPKHSLSEQPTPRPAVGLTASSGESPGCEAADSSGTIDLARVATADDGEKLVDATKEQSQLDLLYQLSASAIESCRGTDLGEPRCYLHVLGFKSPEMETAYLASQSPTMLTGHIQFAAANALYLLHRIINLVRGVNAVEANALTTFFLFTLGIVVVLSASCSVYFSGQEVKLRQSLARMSTGIGVLAASGWFAQSASVLYVEKAYDDDDKSEVFLMAYFIGAWSSIFPSFCLVMLRMPFLLCATWHIISSVLIVCSSISTRPAYMHVLVPLVQVSERPSPARCIWNLIVICVTLSGTVVVLRGENISFDIYFGNAHREAGHRHAAGCSGCRNKR
jgi:hypothetical protein